MPIIKTEQELNFYIAADRMIRGISGQSSTLEKILRFAGLYSLIYDGYIINYLYYLRQLNYYKNLQKPSIIEKIMKKYCSLRHKKLGKKLGFTISPESFGYGLFTPHHGTIVVNNNCQFGN